MAEGTRMKTFEENLRRLEQLQQQHAQTLNQCMESTNGNFGEIRKEFEGQRVSTEDLHARVENVDQNLKNFQANIEQRFENLSDMVRNLSRDSERSAEKEQLDPARNLDVYPTMAPRGSGIQSFHREPLAELGGGRINRVNPDRSHSVDMMEKIASSREHPEPVILHPEASGSRLQSTGSRERVQENLNNGGFPDKGKILIPLDFTSGSRPRIAGQDSRSRIFDDNLRKMKALAEQHASMMQQWWPSTNQTMSESQQEKQSSARAPSNLGWELNLEANSEEQDRGELCSLTDNQEIQELKDSTVNFDTLVVVSDIASVDRSRVIVDSSIGEIVAEQIESSGFGWVDQNPSIFLAISSAHKVFVELSRLGVFQMEPTEISRAVESWVIVDRHRTVDRFSVFDPGIDDRGGFISGEFTILVLVYIEVETVVDRRNWVFDPGKGLELSSHIERVKTILFFEVRSVVVMVEREHRNVSFFVFDPGRETDSLLFNVCLLLVVLNCENEFHVLAG